LIFVIFLSAWSFVAFAATLTIYEFYRISGQAMSFAKVAGMEYSEFLTFIPVSPLAFNLALRVPLQRHAWIKTSLLYLVGGLTFNLGHIAFRGLTPYGYWDPKHQEWTFAFWDTHTHALRNVWAVSKSMFLTSVVDDVIAAYLPILVVAHAFVYYRGLREHEFQSARMAEQLANARLQTLRSQLQPHFLFNTLHSISALMLTDVTAADRMMTSLSDLLRMSLEADAVQSTTLSREMEFLGIYLDIEKIRFEERLRVVLDIAPECFDAQVPHLLLQPLVENAVRHGISKISRNGEIQVVARRGQCRTLEIWVRDNGPGVSSTSEANSRRGLGLRLTRERLAVLYGDNQACEFRNPSAEGTEVYLRLPFTTSDAATLEPTVARKLEPQDSWRPK
jgi:two-component system, LytTR family, sensor kinase